MKKFFISALVILSMISLKPQKSEAIVLALTTAGAVPTALTIAFWAYGGLMGVVILGGCVVGACDDGHAGIGFLGGVIAAAVFDGDSQPGNGVAVVAENQVRKEQAYSTDEQNLIINDLRTANQNFGSKELNIDLKNKTAEQAVEELQLRTGVHQVTAQYLLSKAGLQSEK